MNVEEFYSIVSGNYLDAKRRLLTDEKIVKFLKMIERDDSYIKLKDALANEDYEQAFAAIHTIKGILLNLSIDSLAKTASDLTELLRAQTYNDQISGLYEDFSQKYEHLLECISNLE